MLRTLQGSRFAIAAACAALLLAGCGGIVVGDGVVGGGKPPQHAIDRVARSADSLLLSDLLVSSDLVDIRVQSRCNGTRCTLEAPNLDAVEVSLSDLTDDSVGAWPEAEETHQGVSLASEAGVGMVDGSIAAGDVWAGWLDHNVFLVGHAEFGGTGLGTVRIPLSMSFGDATSRNPVHGSATWSGVMVGVDTSATRFNTVRGDADLTIRSFADPRLDVAFTRIRDVDLPGRRLSDMHWRDVPMSGGGFETASGGSSIQGRFYGPNHGEAGGIFERDEVIGAFGAKRR